jgi:hypothetical protein
VNALEEIHAAVQKLRLYSEGYGVENGWLYEVDTTIIFPDDPRVPLTNNPFEVTLYRMIPAQIALLRSEGEGCGASGDTPDVNIVDLARAINGTA